MISRGIGCRGRSPVTPMMVSTAALAATAKATVFDVVGRHSVSKHGTLFDFQGVQISATLRGTSAARAVMWKASDERDNHFVVWVDGQRLGGVHSFNTTDWGVGHANTVHIPLFSGLDASVPHKVIIVKSSEPAWNTFTLLKGGPRPQSASLASTAPQTILPNYVGFVRFEGDPGMTYGAPPKPPSRRIEFLGDSITAGFCNLGESPGDSVMDESYVASWAHLTCDSLQAQCHTAAWSGFGMAENCCGGDTLASDVWRRTLATVGSDSGDPHGTWGQGSPTPPTLKRSNCSNCSSLFAHADRLRV